MKSKTQQNRPYTKGRAVEEREERKEKKGIVFAQQFKNRLGIVTKITLKMLKTQWMLFLIWNQAPWVTFSIHPDNCCVNYKNFCTLVSHFIFLCRYSSFLTLHFSFWTVMTWYISVLTEAVSTPRDPICFSGLIPSVNLSCLQHCHKAWSVSFLLLTLTLHFYRYPCLSAFCHFS